MNIKIAIPSYNRVNGIIKKTLAFLFRYKYPRELIYIFVNFQEQKEQYETQIPKELYGYIISTNQPKGICYARNFIIDYFEKNEKYISMDDDIHAIQMLQENKLSDIPSIQDLFEKGFQLCEKHKYTLWGLYPTANTFYMINKKEEYTTDLRFIVGGFMGFINQKQYIKLNWKEDYELSIQAYIRNGGVIRFNNIAIKHDLYTKTGGCGLNQKERMNDNKQASECLINIYPSIVKINTRREGEILLNHNANKLVRQFSVSQSIFEKLEILLNKFKIPMKEEAGYNKRGYSSNGRRGFPAHRACSYGLVKYKCGGKIDLSYQTKKHPDIYEELIRIGKIICPFDFTSIMVNNNVVCPLHKDTNNTGESLLVSVGNYEGCNIIVNCGTTEKPDNREYNTRYSPVIFNGALLEHYNTELLSGCKYSLIYFSINVGSRKQEANLSIQGCK